MKEETDRINTWIKEKQEVETTLSKDILHAFDEAPLIGRLRNLVLKGIQELRDIVARHGLHVYQKALRDTANYKWWEQLSVQKEYKKESGFYAYMGQQVAKRATDLDASKCADFIRFYGELLEASGKSPPPRPLTRKISFSNDDVRAWCPKQSRYVCPLDAALQCELFQLHTRALKRKELIKSLLVTCDKERADTLKVRCEVVKGMTNKDLAEGKRRRIKVVPKTPDHSPLTKEQKDAVLTSLKRGTKDSKQKLCLTKEQEDAVLTSLDRVTTDSERSLQKLEGGISIWLALDDDPLSKAAKLFGLAHGATISGTATDTVYFLKRMSLIEKEQIKYLRPLQSLEDQDQGRPVGGPAAGALHPVMYMLPLGTIVGKGHHTTMEVALPLSFNFPQRFRYVVGLYSTLFPERTQDDEVLGGLDEGANKLKEALEKAEESPTNRLMVVYYVGVKAAGCFLFDKTTDRDVWLQLARANRDFVRRIDLLGDYPSRSQVVNWLTQNLGASAISGLRV